MQVSHPIEVPSDNPFGLQNLPYGVFSRKNLGEQPQRRPGTAVGDYVLDLSVLVDHDLFDTCIVQQKVLKQALSSPTLAPFAALPASDRLAVRETITKLLTTPDSPLFSTEALNAKVFVPVAEVQMHLPFEIGSYTDHLCSMVHMQNLTKPFQVPIPRSMYEYPLGYNGRPSSIVVSGTPVTRPRGFILDNIPGASRPTYQLSRELDYEVELGIFISKPVPQGSIISSPAAAAEHIFGYTLLNDWSSRDIQKYEMPLLGPLHSKSFATTVSPWVVPLEALQSSGCGPPAGQPQGLLECGSNATEHGMFDIELEVFLKRGDSPREKIARSNLRDAYWAPFQILTYLASSGCGLRTGDLVGSGTISSPHGSSEDPSSNGQYVSPCGCIAEMLAVEKNLPQVGGQSMSYLQDGDELSFEGRFRNGGFGGVSGVIMPGAVV